MGIALGAVALLVGAMGARGVHADEATDARAVARDHVASWRSAGANERVLLFPSRDQLWPGRIPAGLPVVVTVRTGVFGVQWVDSVSRDDDQLAERLLEAVPTARLPRRRLIETRLREGRWADAAAHARKYLEHYPRDREFAGQVAAALRGAGHAQAAAGLEPRTR